MSANDKARVKAAMAVILESGPGQFITSINPSYLARRVEERTGLAFSPTTIARYLAGLGWTRRVTPKGVVTYERPRS